MKTAKKPGGLPRKKQAPPSKKDMDAAQELMTRMMTSLYASGADGRLLSALVSRCCSGMSEGDRFYHASDDTWWEWRGGRLRGSGPPAGYTGRGSRR